MGVGGILRRALVSGCIVLTAMVVAIAAASAGSISFSTPRVMGYPPAGDDWEPAVASDGLGNVYVLSTHLSGIPGCGGCATDSIVVQVSHDGGKTFTAPAPVTINSASQFDPNVKINSAGVVFISYLFGKDTVVQRSTDHGATWSAPVSVIAGVKQGTSDKPGLAVQGNDVYVGFDISQSFFVSSSHDGGQSFNAVLVGSNVSGLVLNGGAVVDGSGIVYLSWEAVHKSGNAQGPQDVIVTKSVDKGATWTVSTVDSNLPPGPPCPTTCGWDYLGTGSAISVDGAGTLYVLYNAPLTANGSPFMWYKTSTDGGKTWSARVQVSGDGTNAYHVFPATAAGAAGDVRVSWMDNRTGAYNVWYRSSSDGGHTWSAEIRVSQFRSGYSYVTSAGFAFPYGDYFILNLDPKGHVHIAWGEGPNWVGPGNTLYSTA